MNKVVFILSYFDKLIRIREKHRKQCNWRKWKWK